MAINKNFVIKNGLEVNTNVLVAASDEQQVGVGTTRPYYKLHVGVVKEIEVVLVQLT